MKYPNPKTKKVMTTQDIINDVLSKSSCTFSVHRPTKTIKLRIRVPFKKCRPRFDLQDVSDVYVSVDRHKKIYLTEDHSNKRYIFTIMGKEIRLSVPTVETSKGEHPPLVVSNEKGQSIKFHEYNGYTPYDLWWEMLHYGNLIEKAKEEDVLKLGAYTTVSNNIFLAVNKELTPAKPGEPI